MGFIRSGFRSTEKLNEMVNRFLALQYIGIADNIQSTPSKEVGSVTQSVVRARVVQLNLDGTNPVDLGETLVFQQIIARDLVEKPSDWHLGVLTELPQAGDTEKTVYRLNPPSDLRAYERAEAAMTAAGMG